jgi:amino acid permease (GABA permease)
VLAKQLLDFRVFSNFAISFSIISVLTGITTTYNTGLRFGGTVTLVYGWFLAGSFTMCVGLSMAEICSSYPTSGGLYYWSAMLAGPRWAPLASWMTGWFNIVGQWAVTASVDFSLAQLIQVIVLLSTGGRNGGGYKGSDFVVIGIHGGILFIHALLNSLPISVLSFIGQLAALWNLLGVLVLMILIPLVSTERATTKFVFTNFNTDNGLGITSYAYIFVLGLLMSQYTITGYDASAHMTEETVDADKNGPRGIISAIGISILFGWGYILGISYAVTDIPSLLSETNNSGGYAIAEIFYLAFKNRFGSGTGGIVCLGVVAVAVFFCGMSSVTSNSRMAYAFSRDGAMPMSPLWHKVNSREVPINAVWLSALISFCMALTVSPLLSFCVSLFCVLGLLIDEMKLAVTGEHSGVPSNGVDRNDWTVHSIRNPDYIESDACAQHLRTWTIQPGKIRNGSRVGGSPVGCNHISPLLLTRGISHNSRDTQLHSGGSCWFGGHNPLILAFQCPPLVYGSHLQHS